MADALISIKPKHVENILSGAKTVELRTRSVNLEVGDTLWIYSTLPQGCINTVATIEFVITDTRSTIWDNYRDQIYITKSDFDDYTNGIDKLTIIGLGSIKKISEPITLSQLRAVDSKFSPPQFYSRISSAKSIYPILQCAS